MLFSAAHYIGAYGDRLTLYSFVFRMIAGVFFSALYLMRGFGVTAWTHALYDVLLLFAWVRILPIHVGARQPCPSSCASLFPIYDVTFRCAVGR